MIAGQIAINRSITLGGDQWKELDRHLEQTAFWDDADRRAS